MIKKKVFSPQVLDRLLGGPGPGKRRVINASAIAEKAGISSNYLSCLRKGEKNNPSADIVGGLAFALQKPIQVFFEDEDIVNQKQLKISANSGQISA